MISDAVLFGFWEHAPRLFEIALGVTVWTNFQSEHGIQDRPETPAIQVVRIASSQILIGSTHLQIVAEPTSTSNMAFTCCCSSNVQQRDSALAQPIGRKLNECKQRKSPCSIAARKSHFS